MNKRIILTSILAMSFAFPAMAGITQGNSGGTGNSGNEETMVTVQPGIGGSEQCDSATLGQSENNSTANVEAIWTPNTYKIRYRCNDTQSFPICNGGKFQAKTCDQTTYDESFSFKTPEEILATIGSISSAACFETIGYTFNNWSCVDANNNTTIYNAGQPFTWNIASDLDCTAQWNANIINIDWNPQNGEARTLNTCTYGETITLPVEPTKTGYTFAGWVLHDDCAGLNSQSTCNAINYCFWNENTNSCANGKLCLNLNEQECSTNPNCGAITVNDTFRACTISDQLRCSKNTDENSCTQSGCTWEDNKCIETTLSLLG